MVSNIFSLVPVYCLVKIDIFFISVSQLKQAFGIVHFWKFSQNFQLFDVKILEDKIFSYLTPVVGEKRIVHFTSRPETEIL